ncbi:MAG: protein phosphatase 2C domain-containing protein [Ktedonobacteraceae bacterium]|nr:protein phosphatase 2C domain-containing protein [Ktedonobacteraceae bacterium]MBO0793128.1 protein phosphatase 2C domain-containing protein [Ktedonobacteraceae bacterium]
MLCPSCNTLNRENARFCKGCGLSFVPQTAPAPQEQAQPEQAEEQAGTAEAAAQPAAVDQNPSPPPEVAPDEPEPQAVEVVADDDISLAPTQILTPEKMMAYHTQRWWEESKQAPSAQSEAEAEEEERRKQAIADSPTIMFGLAEPSAPQMEPDVSVQPTMIIEPGEQESSTVGASEAAGEPDPGADSSVPAAEGETAATEPAEPAENQQATAEAGSAEATAADDASPTTAQEEESMEQEQDQQQVTENETSQEQATATFPTLAEGTLVAGRYEIVQVLSENESEHTYQVNDQQGYKHCWNCGSEQNVEGDEFCIDCGAELNNAAYILHEYHSAESASQETNVLQGTIVNTFVDQERTYAVEQPQATQSSFPTGVHLIAACDSDAGDLRRSEPNEDSTLVLQIQRVHESIAAPSGVFLVADGMGGHDKGQVASRMTVNVISERIIRELIAPPLLEEQDGKPQERGEESYVALLRGAIEDANTELCQANQNNKSDMGSTLTGFMMVGDFAFVFNVGDSRTYMLHEGNLYQLTNDHSLVGQLVAGGLIEPDDVYTHPQRNQIYRSIGDKPNVQIDIFKQQVHPGDILLSCSDGLWEMVRDPQIATMLNNAPDPQTACAQLIEAANANGGEDNVSAVVVFVR